MKISKKLNAWFDDYDKYHRHPKNKLTHYVGIPLIIFGLFGLLERFFVTEMIHGSDLLLGFSLTLYLWMDIGMALLFTPVIFAFYFIGRELNLPISTSLFVVGWIFQLVGHYRFEGKSPALLKNIMQLWIGPLWIFAKAIGAR